LWWRYNPAEARLDVLSIPRDTRVGGTGRRFRRINEVYAAQFAQTHDDRRASEALREAIGGLLGVAGTPLEPRQWVHVDYEGFRRFVDTVGGVRVHVDEPMNYDDKAGDLHIHYEPGEYVLSGSRSLEYVRFRGRSGDRGRILRQMDFFRALIHKAASPEIFLRWPRLLAVAAGGLRSNLTWPDLLCLAVEVKHVRPERITPAILPGRPVGAEWAVDEKRLAYMMAQWGAVVAEPPPAGPLANKITIRVGNATRRQGLALSATRRLRAAGFDVVDWGDYNARQTKTRVVDRVGAIENARKVAQAMGTDFVLSDVDPSLRTDVEVVLGDDYLEGRQ
jgi:LCP family protein required for cell wall assembly